MHEQEVAQRHKNFEEWSEAVERRNKKIIKKNKNHNLDFLIFNLIF